ncbi:MAG: PilN domain-containing protein [Pyrinomonadaceae bacterium]|nr:PilN domain-containing protein [Pyrinomonadaceae bacterium]
MIKVNLLDSVTDRARGVAVVEQKVTNPAMQTLLMGVVVLVLMVAGMGYDYVSAGAAKAKAQKDLEEQQRIAAQMAAINKEQAELEKKTKDIQVRIDAIQKLRASQQGPGNVLREIKERVDTIPGLYLESVEQKGNEIVIKGDSPNEASVTRFGQSLEFSQGQFSNLDISTERKQVKISATEVNGVPVDPAAPKPEVVSFTIKCNYSQPGGAQPAAAPANAPTNQVAQK